MSQQMRLAATVTKIAMAVALSIVLFIITIAAIRSPVEGDSHTFSAEFTDVSGLRPNADVRSKGVRIGKVKSIDGVRIDGRSLAEVEFTLVEPFELNDNTKLAIKYQNLTGARYIDLQEAKTPGPLVDHLPADKTQGSYDITQLFNGLQPVLTTMTTDEINEFTQNAITLLEGDGQGLAPMLDSFQKMMDFAHDRESVISVLVTNLSRISEHMGGRSAQVQDFIKSLEIPVDAAMTVLEQFGKTAETGPVFMAPVYRLVDALGLSKDVDVDQLLAGTFSSLTAAADAIRLLPVTFAGLQLPQLATQPGALNCANGVAVLPTDVELFLNASEVVVCNAR